MAGTVDDKALLQQGVDWVACMTSGTATEADVEALRRWYRQSPRHARAFHEAVAFRDALIEAGRQGLVARRAVQQGFFHVDRRMLLAGGMASAAAAAVTGIVRPPLGLWPSLGDLMADYRTSKGEQRRIALAHGLSVEMNTKTSLTRITSVEGEGLKLIDGEVAVNASLKREQTFVLTAGRGTIVARDARFDVRRDDSNVCVTCSSGTLRVTAGEHDVRLTGNQQVVYSSEKFGPVTTASAALVTAWRAGLIVLRNKTLAQAVAEINRYRPGMIVIGSATLRRQHINTVLHLAQLDHAVALICDATGAHATEIGDFVLLS